MSPVTWLPPLNSHDNFYTSVHVIQEHPHVADRRSPGTLPEFLHVELSVDVTYHSGEIKSEKSFEGLYVLQDFEFRSNLDYLQLASKISNDILNSTYVPLQLDGADYLESRILPKQRESGVTAVTRDVLVERITDFLRELVADPTNAGHEKVHVHLFVEKSIQVPKNELEAWFAWYEEQVRVYPMFEDEYLYAISRPRTEGELWDEAMRGSYKSADKAAVEALEQVSRDSGCSDMKTCSVCLEDLGGGVSKLRRMGCRHVFHEECIVRWLKTSHVCPLCRYMLPTAS